MLAVLLMFLFTGTYSQPVIEGYKVYYGDLHNHCNVSDGTGTIDDAYNYAKNVSQLDFFSLADHANLISSSEWTQIKNVANAYNQDSVFTAFYGFEWTTYLSYGHVTVINSDDYCSNSGSTANFSGLLNWVSSRNCIAFFNHPGWEFYTYYEFNHFTDSPSPKFVGMELWNTQDGFSKYYYNDGFYGNDGNKGYFDEALIRHWKIGAAGGDDNHTANWGNVKPWRTGVLAMAKTRTDILNAYQSKRIFSTLDKTLVLSLKVNGFMMGSTMLGGNWNAVVNAYDLENELFTKVELLKNGAVIYSTIPNLTHPILTIPVTCTDGDYIYARVKEADGDEAISSPVFISGMAQPPLVSITTPVSGSSFVAGSDISIAANASDPDGSIMNVMFYSNNTMLGQDNSAPYSLVWPCDVAGTYMIYAKAYDNYGLMTVSDSVQITVQPDIPLDKILNLELLIQGLCDASGMMTEVMDATGMHWGDSIADKITVELHDASNYAVIVHTVSDVVLHTDGTAILSIPAQFNGNYYLTVKHRNSIETVSMLPVSFAADLIAYDFTDLASKAFGNNLVHLPCGKWAIYAGDISQDGIVDSGDMIIVDNGASTFSTGYLPDDCNGDGIIDSSDMLLVDNNNRLFIIALTP